MSVPGCPQKLGFGLGWIVSQHGPDTVRWHGGGDWGERTLAFYFPDREAGGVIFTNGANGSHLIVEVLQLLFPDSPFTSFHRSRLESR